MENQTIEQRSDGKPEQENAQLAQAPTIEEIDRVLLCLRRGLEMRRGDVPAIRDMLSYR